MSKKYLIVHKKKIDLLNNEYLFYNTSVEFINKISENKNKIKSISSKNSTYVGKAIFSKSKGKIEFLNNLNILEGKLYIKKGITEDKFKFIGNNDNLAKQKASVDSFSLSQSIYNFDNNDNKFFELSGVLDRYYYEKIAKQSNENGQTEISKNRFYNRLTILYGISNGEEGDEIVNLSFDRSNEIKNIFDSEKMLNSICKLDNFSNKIFDHKDKFQVNTNLKMIDGEIPSCSICLEDFEIIDEKIAEQSNDRYKCSESVELNEKQSNDDCELYEELYKEPNLQITLNCGHSFHADCLDSIITSDLKNELSRLQNNRQNLSEFDIIKEFKKSINLSCPLCRKDFELITYDEMNFGLLDSKVPKSKDDKFIFNYSPIKGGIKSVYNIHLKDIFNNDFIKMLKLNDDIFSVEYTEFSGENFNSKMHSIHNSKVPKIISILNLIS